MLFRSVAAPHAVDVASRAGPFSLGHGVALLSDVAVGPKPDALEEIGKSVV